MNTQPDKAKVDVVPQTKNRSKCTWKRKHRPNGTSTTPNVSLISIRWHTEVGSTAAVPLAADAAAAAVVERSASDMRTVFSEFQGCSVGGRLYTHASRAVHEKINAVRKYRPTGPNHRASCAERTEVVHKPNPPQPPPMTERACLTDAAPAQLGEGYPHDTRHSLDYTYSLDRLSCARMAYFVHITFAYLVFFSGLACFAARVYPHLHPWHAMFGRLYILCMLWCMATSLIVHNVGLPVGVLVSFFIVLMGLSLGWGCIKIHQGNVQAKTMRRVDDMWEKGTTEPQKPSALMHTARQSIFKNRSIRERILSFKAAHGALMFMSWVNIAGRLFSSNQSGNFTCHTYPVYKQLDSAKFSGLSQSLTYVPIKETNSSKLPWSDSLIGWGLEMSVVPFAGSLLIGLMFILIDIRFNSNTPGKGPINHAAAPFQMPRMQISFTPLP